MKNEQVALKAYIITTEHRGVWYAEIPAEDYDLTQTTFTGLRNCRMAIRWGTTKGLHQLADTGPTENSRISAKADIPVLHKVTAVISVTDNARAVWQKYL